MKKRKIKNRKLSRVFIIGSLIILLGITLISLKVFSNYYLDKQEDKAIQEYLDYKPDTTVKVDNSTTTIKEEKETVTYNYIAVLDIPKINLKRGLFPINDKNNNVDKNVEILQNSDMPNVTNGTLALAGHSGNSRIAYFHKLYKLKENDVFSIKRLGKYKYIGIIKETKSKNYIIKCLKYK